MSDFTKARDAAAENYVANTVVEGGNGPEMEACFTDFKAGADFGFAYALESEEVRELVEALEEIGAMYPDEAVYESPRVARKALKAIAQKLEDRRG